ncbi:NnrS protein involved in response to NO [Georgfuchsia toluolica]|uniref:NnrS protein involved in response to NO n=1 Tax=Georgfuchsia toluolica TaxID=424218 RepID=A0A916J6Y7_9PROT|nr:NnrS family protein [Georgfuchsia toluolica]CAG4884325.1 NnrS protein involved in response to NO [Georgfuchsia toluolica]
MKISEHSLWLAGFRPFFTLAFLTGMALPILWALVFSGALTLPALPFSIVQWHAHEMFFGFGWSVLGGFLLTATKNWVNIRGYRGNTLILLVVAWLIERAGMWFAGSLPPLLFAITNNLFLAAIIAMLLWTLLRYRETDSYRSGNLFFLLVLPAFLLAKNLLLSQAYSAIGYSMTLGLFRMAFLLMLERTLTQFMKGVFQVDILRNKLLDSSIRLLALAFVFESLLPQWLAAVIALLLALLLLLRLMFWKPQLALRRLDTGIMYLGYLALTAQLLVIVAGVLHLAAWVGSVSVHVFAFGVMGLIIPAMLIRICNGHTGRKVVFDGRDKLALWIMMAAFVLRIVAPQFFPALYLRWVEFSALCWFACFALLGWRYIPFLMQARVDGKTY